MKYLDYDKKLKALKELINNESLKDSKDIINISFLVKRLNQLDNEIFKREDIYYNSLMELIDLKINLKKELEELRKKIVIYYLGCLKSLTIKNEEQAIHINNLYFHLLHILDINDISVILQKVEIKEEIPFIHNSKEIYRTRTFTKNFHFQIG